MGIFANHSERKLLEAKMRQEGRLPPGQSLTLKWPVLHTGGVPSFNPAAWSFWTGGLVLKPLRLTWAEFNALPAAHVTSDFHCVTRWSRFDNRWEGVAFPIIAELTRVRPEARHVLVHGEGEYTANIPLPDLVGANVLFASKHDGEPLAGEHGGPLRLVVPHLYGWKSVKWVRGLEFLAEDQLGFWERNGYHRYGDPWKEQRFDND